MKAKQAIEILQKYNPEEDIFFDVYSKADLDYLDNNVKAKITDEMMTTIYETMDNWATTDNFCDAVNQVLSDNKIDA
jgi:hypothetical protein